MKTIPTEFHRSGYDCRLIERRKNFALYELTHRATGKVISWEVMRVQRFKRAVIIPGGVSRDEGDEFLPSTEKWGSEGWTFQKRALALQYIAKKGI